jgi:hypothetical protein
MLRDRRERNTIEKHGPFAPLFIVCFQDIARSLLRNVFTGNFTRHPLFDMEIISAALNKPDRSDLEKEREERKSRLNEIKWF